MGYSGHFVSGRDDHSSPTADEQTATPNEPRLCRDPIEPFVFTMCHPSVEKRKDIKIIWWYVAVLPGAVATSRAGGEKQFAAESFLWGKLGGGLLSDVTVWFFGDQTIT
jgi:hypothetical protein